MYKRLIYLFVMSAMVSQVYSQEKEDGVGLKLEVDGPIRMNVLGPYMDGNGKKVSVPSSSFNSFNEEPHTLYRVKACYSDGKYNEELSIDSTYPHGKSYNSYCCLEGALFDVDFGKDRKKTFLPKNYDHDKFIFYSKPSAWKVSKQDNFPFSLFNDKYTHFIERNLQIQIVNKKESEQYWTDKERLKKLGMYCSPGLMSGDDFLPKNIQYQFGSVLKVSTMSSAGNSYGASNKEVSQSTSTEKKSSLNGAVSRKNKGSQAQ